MHLDTNRRKAGSITDAQENPDPIRPAVRMINIDFVIITLKQIRMLQNVESFWIWIWVLGLNRIWRKYLYRDTQLCGTRYLSTRTTSGVTRSTASASTPSLTNGCELWQFWAGSGSRLQSRLASTPSLTNGCWSWQSWAGSGSRLHLRGLYNINCINALTNHCCRSGSWFEIERDPAVGSNQDWDHDIRIDKINCISTISNK